MVSCLNVLGLPNENTLILKQHIIAQADNPRYFYQQTKPTKYQNIFNSLKQLSKMWSNLRKWRIYELTCGEDVQKKFTKKLHIAQVKICVTPNSQR